MTWHWRLFIPILFWVSAAWSGADAQESIQPSLVLFKPLIQVAPGSNLTHTVFYGRVGPGQKIRLDTNLIVSVGEMEDSKVPLQRDKIIDIVANREGYFRLLLNLPMGQFQIFLSVFGGQNEQDSKPDKKTSYVLSMTLTPEGGELFNSVIEDTKQIENWRAIQAKYYNDKYNVVLALRNRLAGTRVFIGAGANYQIYSQSLGALTDISFQSLRLPTFSLGVFHDTPDWHFAIDFKQTPGEASGVNAPFSLKNGKYNWENYTLEVGRNSHSKRFSENTRLTYLFGYQAHLIPFFRIDLGNEVVNERHQMSSVFAGGAFAWDLGSAGLVDCFIRYQSPISTGSFGRNKFEITGDFLFDGSVSYRYKLNEANSVGFGWFGQWHKFKYDHYNAKSSTSTSGTDELFYTNVELRWIHKL